MLSPFSRAAIAAFLCLTPAIASAHISLVRSTPAAQATASKVAVVTLTFSDKVAPGSIKTELVMTGMPGMADHPPMKISVTAAIGKDGKTVTLTPKRALVPGTYKVSWAATGADGHAMRGAFDFTAK